jgi:hypothetical protein
MFPKSRFPCWEGGHFYGCRQQKTKNSVELVAPLAPAKAEVGAVVKADQNSGLPKFAPLVARTSLGKLNWDLTRNIQYQRSFLGSIGMQAFFNFRYQETNFQWKK